MSIRIVKVFLMGLILLTWSGASLGAELAEDPALLAELKTIAGFENKVVRPIGLLPSGPHPGPPDNPTTPAKAELGAMMFFEPRLSGDTSTPCSKCHDPKMGWGTSDDVSVGYPGTQHFRNSHTVLNSAYLKKLFWDGRVTSLEAQFWAAAGGESAGNMSTDMGEARLRQVPEYRKKFMEVFGELPTADNVARAGAAFERTLVLLGSPFDRFMAGDKSALSEAAQAGFKIFQRKGKCKACHELATFTDQQFHNIGVPSTEPDVRDLGRYEVTNREQDRGAFKTPTLRNAALTAPYMHNGVFKTLEEVVDFYGKGGGPNPNLSSMIAPLKLKLEEKKALVEFLKSLTGELPLQGSATELDRGTGSSP